jgi:hypothetical protein
MYSPDAPFVIGFIWVQNGVLHFAHKRWARPMFWSAFIGLLAGLGIGIPILISAPSRRMGGSARAIPSAVFGSWIGLGVGLVLACFGSVSCFWLIQLTPARADRPPCENRLAYDARRVRVLGETAQVRARCCGGGVRGGWSVSSGCWALRRTARAAAATADVPFAGLLPFAAPWCLVTAGKL